MYILFLFVKLKTFLLVVLFVSSLFFISFSPGYGENVRATINFGKVNIHFFSTGNGFNLTINDTQYVEIYFERIFLGDSTFHNFRGFWYSDLQNMNYTYGYSSSKLMGKYFYIHMWKNGTLKRIGLGERYNFKLLVNFYVASKNYTKNGISVGRNTIRYDVIISTDSPAKYVYLEHTLHSNLLEKAWTYSSHSGHWHGLLRTSKMMWLNRTHKMRMAFGNYEGNRHVEYMWIGDKVKALYTYYDEHVNIFFVYNNTGFIVQDPYISLPYPILPNGTAEKIVNYFAEHVESIAVGTLIAGAIILAPAILRRRKL